MAPPKALGSFTRSIGSSHGQALSPRASSHNLAESHNRLSSLAERPTTSSDNRQNPRDKDSASAGREGTNGMSNGHALKDIPLTKTPSSILNGTAEDIFDAQPSKQEASKDAEGFTIPTSTNDPIAQAQREAAAEEADQVFKVNIQNEPIAEEDQDAKKAALSNVANTLSVMGMPSRKTGTVRGRREVRHTIYMPTLPVPENAAESASSQPPPSPSLPANFTATPKPTPSATFASEASATSYASHPSYASDTHSIRSGTSLGGASSYSGIPRMRHPEMQGPEYGPGLHSSIIETVSASFEEGVVKSARVTGEIALSYTPDPESLYPGRAPPLWPSMGHTS